MSDCPMLISNKLHSFRNFCLQIYNIKRALSSPDRNNPLNSEKVSCLEINIGYVFLAFFKSFQRLLG